MRALFKESENLMLSQLAALAGQVRAEVDAARRSQFGVGIAEEDRFNNSNYKGPKYDCARAREVRNRRRRKKSYYEKQVHCAEPGEVWMGDFVRAEAKRLGLALATVYQRLLRGYYPGVKIRRLNQRRAFVRVESLEENAVSRPLAGEISLKEFVAAEARRLNITVPAVYNRLSRGKYPVLKTRRVNDRTVFVKVLADGHLADGHKPEGRG